jgi:hypothetical protein
MKRDPELEAEVRAELERFNDAFKRGDLADMASMSSPGVFGFGTGVRFLRTNGLGSR